MVDETHDIKIFEEKRKELLVRNANTAWKLNGKQCCLQVMGIQSIYTVGTIFYR